MKRFATASAVLLLLGLSLAATPAQAQEDLKIVVLTSANKPLPSLRDAATASRLRPPSYFP